MRIDKFDNPGGFFDDMVPYSGLGLDGEGLMELDEFNKNVDDSKRAIIDLSKKTLLEEYGMGEEVMKMLLHGISHSEIFSKMKKEHGFAGDLQQFVKHVKTYLGRNRDFVELAKVEEKGLAVQHLNARKGCVEELAKVFKAAQRILKKCEDDKDYTNANNSLRVLNITIMNAAKLSGFLDEGDTNINITMVNKVSEENRHLREEVINANFKFDDEKED